MGRLRIGVIALALVAASFVLWRRYPIKGLAASRAAPALSVEVARLRTEVDALRSRPPGAPQRRK